MYCDKFLSNYNYESYQYMELVKIIRVPHLLYIFPNLLSLILIKIINNQKVNVNFCKIYHFPSYLYLSLLANTMHLPSIVNLS